VFEQTVMALHLQHARTIMEEFLRTIDKAKGPTPAQVATLEESNEFTAPPMVCEHAFCAFLRFWASRGGSRNV
jgi:hypothetical protein